jgi:hypothetical protein
MVDVSWDDHSPTGDFVAYQLRRQLLFVGNVSHFFGDYTFAGIVHLREVAIVIGLASCDPLSPRLWN